MSDVEKIPLPVNWRTFVDRRSYEMLRDMDKRTKVLCATLRDWFKDRYEDSQPYDPEPTLEDAVDPERPGKNRLTPADRPIAALHVLSGEYTFETIPHAMLHLLQGQVPVWIEKKAASIAMLRIVSKKTFLGAVTDLLSGIFGIPAQRQLRASIEADIREKGHAASAPFQKDKPNLFGFLSSQGAIMRHPKSSGEPIVGLDGKVRGRKREIRDVQTRHWRRPKVRRSKNGRFA